MAVFSKMLLPIALPLLSLFNSATAAPAASGTFNALTLNVAGLPPILNGNGIPGDKETNTKLIGTYFAQYNYSIIHVQEDFNFHAALYSTDTHPYRTGTSGGVPFGSGLNTLSVFNWVDFVRTKWATCSIGSGDCLTPKGFTFMRVQVSQGVWIDAYNLHADAGTEAGDLTARAANLKQVSDYIAANSGGNAVLVFGDTNSRYTRAADIPGIFASANGMTDAWVQLAKGGVAPVGGSPDLLCSNPSSTLSCEIVDKLWYRGSPALTLTAKKFDYVGEKFLQPDGNITSDHDPVLVDFSWSLNAKLRIADYFGGEGGAYYNDITTLNSIASPKVSSVTLKGAERLDSVALSLSSGQTFTHGGTGGTTSTLKLNSGETLTSATLCQDSYNSGSRLFYAQLTTSSGRTVAAGTKTGNCVTQSAESGFGIVGAVGRSADGVDRLAFIYGKQ